MNSYERAVAVLEPQHDEGAKVIKYSDGNLWPIVDLIVDTGIDEPDSIEPAAGMDICYFKNKLGVYQQRFS